MTTSSNHSWAKVLIAFYWLPLCNVEFAWHQQRKKSMADHATVKGLVQYRAGDGPLLEIPQGPIEVELAVDSAVVSWTHEEESLNTAIPLQDYQKYIDDGLIQKG